jgi:hypothetical protein
VKSILKVKMNSILNRKSVEEILTEISIKLEPILKKNFSNYDISICLAEEMDDIHCVDKEKLFAIFE